MIGVKLVNNKWEAKIGKKVLGQFNTKEEAMKCYDDHAKKIFKFPVLNNKEQENESSNE